MEFDFGDADLEDVYYNPLATLGLGPAVDKGFRKVIGKIDSAETELVLRSLKGLHYHKLDGDRAEQHALNITDKYRLIVERQQLEGRIKLRIIAVKDYH